MAAFTKAERNAIEQAWLSITRICESTNWSDAPQFREAVRLERKETRDATAAKAMACKAWFEGFGNPDKPARDLYWIRPGYLSAMLLGVRHAVERADHPGIGHAMEACPAAIAANDAHTQRIVGQVAGDRAAHNDRAR